jgi:hypothetical protein
MVECHMAEARGCFTQRHALTSLCMHSAERHFQRGLNDSSTEKCLPSVGARNGDWMHVNAVEVQHFAGRVLEARAQALASGGAVQERKA